MVLEIAGAVLGIQDTAHLIIVTAMATAMDQIIMALRWSLTITSIVAILPCIAKEQIEVAIQII